MLNITNYVEAELPYFLVKGLEMNERNERLTTIYITSLYDYLMVNKRTLNNWKNGQLVIRYARNYEELRLIEKGIEQDSKLPKNHEERSLIY